MTPARTTPGRLRRGGWGWGWGGGPPPGEDALAPASVSVPETEQEYVELFQDRIASSQFRQLFPLQEDLADWINRTLDADHVTGENFLEALDNGVLVCHLAQAIQKRAQELVSRGEVPGPAPRIHGRCWEGAARRSFFCRDNLANFIEFCRGLGVHPDLVFESDDLALHHNPRSVVLTLLEVARLAQAWGFEPPGLVQLEREIAEEEGAVAGGDGGGDRGGPSASDHEQPLSWQFRRAPDKIRHSSSSSAISGSVTRWGRPVGRPRTGERRSLMLVEASHMSDADGQLSPAPPPRDLRRTASEGNTAGAAGTATGSTPGGASDGVPSDTTEDEWSRGSGEDPDLELEDTCLGVAEADMSELDRRVEQTARSTLRHCQCPPSRCPRLRMRKLGEGRYSVAGRNVFVRLLKGRHMMVRVGGGWDTLEHFLVRHDPCQVKVVGRDSPSNRAYLHIQAKYRSP